MVGSGYHTSEEITSEGLELSSMMRVVIYVVSGFFCQAEDGIRYLVRSRGLGDVYKRQELNNSRKGIVVLQLLF